MQGRIWVGYDQDTLYRYVKLLTDDFKEIASPRYSRVTVNMNSEQLRQHAQGLCKSKPNQIPAQKQNLGIKYSPSHEVIGNC